MYGMHPRKGTIAIDADADIAIWDPARQVKITAGDLHHGADYTPYEGFEVTDLHHGADYTPYEGFEVTGWPVTTIVRGKVVSDHGKLVASLGHGAYFKRARSDYAVPAGGRTA
jgi:dihydropyrimidinase